MLAYAGQRERSRDNYALQKAPFPLDFPGIVGLGQILKDRREYLRRRWGERRGRGCQREQRAPESGNGIVYTPLSERIKTV